MAFPCVCRDESWAKHTPRPDLTSRRSLEEGHRAQGPPTLGSCGESGELVAEVGLMEGNHASDKPIMQAVKILERRNL